MKELSVDPLSIADFCMPNFNQWFESDDILSRGEGRGLESATPAE